MTQQGAVLQGYNNELVKCIEDLCMQKQELTKEIQQAEEEKNKLQHEIQVLNEELERVCENLAQKEFRILMHVQRQPLCAITSTYLEEWRDKEFFHPHHFYFSKKR
ncbi:microtubule nucleation factor SSNA1-like isoform X4 [Pogoniulus pusillus]|uniref:microtubule nucleation factor SSNA1-like isoform X4 n=1 Tax=Pogoniulus pusillus TaxID=488313 RepID=UPI0030B93D7F